MAYTGTSQWNPTTSDYGTKEQVDSTGLTPKQIDMSTARNPMNANQRNKALPQGAAPEPKKPKAVPQAADKEQQEATRAEVNKMRSTIGTAAYSVQGMVNKFLKEGTAQAGLKDNSKMVFDPVTKTMKYENGKDAQYDLDAVIQEKLGQQSALKQAAAPFYTQDPTGKWKSKSLEEYVTTQPTYSKLDLNKKQQVDSLMGIASTINEYEARGQGGSAEAQALREQLQALDKNGIVTGMYKAIEDYQKFAGKAGTQGEGALKWYGDEGDTGMGIVDILNMDQKRIEEEVNKAMTTSGGMFGGDYEAGLKRQVDTESAEAKAGQQQEIQYRNELLKASDVFFKSSQETLTKNAAQLKTAFDSAVPSILDNLKKEGTNAAREAIAFFTALQGSTPEQFGELINKLLSSDSGLAVEERNQLRKMLGSAAGGSGTGQIQEWIDQLGSKGSITIESPDGTSKEVELNAEQKFQVLQALKGGDEAKIKSVMDAAIGTTEVGSMLNKALTNSAPEDIQGHINAFVGSLTDSLKSLAGSKTEEAVRLALNIEDGVWRQMTKEQRSERIAAALEANPGIAFSAVEAAMSDRTDTAKATFDATKLQLDQAESGFTAQESAINKAIETVTAQKSRIVDSAAAYIQDIYSRSWQTSSEKYRQYFNKNSEQFSRLGYKPDEINKAVDALANRDAFLAIKKSNPDLYSAMTSSLSGKLISFLEEPSGNAINSALMDPSFESSTMDILRAYSTNRGGVLDSVVPNIQMFRDLGSRLDSSLVKLNSALTQIGTDRKAVAGYRTSLDNMAKTTKDGIFSPQDIAKFALEVGGKYGSPEFKQTFKDLVNTYAPNYLSDIVNQAAGATEIRGRKAPSEVGQTETMPYLPPAILGAPAVSEGDIGAAATVKDMPRIVPEGHENIYKNPEVMSSYVQNVMYPPKPAEAPPPPPPLPTPNVIPQGYQNIYNNPAVQSAYVQNQPAEAAKQAASSVAGATNDLASRLAAILGGRK